MADTGSDRTEASGPLRGLRAVELGSTVAGPFCARMLADFGADVIKIEQPEGDLIRSMGSQKDGRSLYGASILRSKRIVSINLRSDRGRALAKRLCETADIVVENFRPGTLERWGLGYEDLRTVNPGLIMVRISVYGQDGPYSGRPGYGVTSEAMSGLRGITGYADQPPPRVATSLGDYIAGLYAAFGAVAAALARERSGRGQIVDSALYEGAFSFMEPHVPAYSQLGKVAGPAGSRLPGSTPNALYPTADGAFIHITAVSDSVFSRLAHVMNRSAWLQDPRFATAVARSANEDLMDEMIGAWTAEHALEDLERMLDDAKVPAARIYSVADIFADPHYRHREMLVDLEDEVLGPVTVPGIVPKLSETPGAARWAGHQIGDDTREILRVELGLSDGEIEALARDGIVTGPDLPEAASSAGRRSA